MQAVQVAAAGGPLELVDRPMPEPRRGEVRIKVEACGICHSDSFAKDGTFPGIAFPLIPGHEVVGRIDALGPEVTRWRLGQRVGIGWFGGNCGVCPACREGDFMLCETLGIPGITYDGGYAEYMVAPANALAAMPESLASAEAAPLLCAGITTFNALRHSGAQAGDLVAVLGLGGLGHLGVQFAARMGFDTVAIARGADKGEFARRLGARHYIDSRAETVAEALKKLGGAKIVLATVTSAEAMSATIDGLGRGGTLIVLGASPDPIQVSPFQLIGKRRGIRGWPSGTAADSEDTLDFSAQAGILPMIERYPLARAAEAYDRMMSGQARFRVVLEMGA